MRAYSEQLRALQQNVLQESLPENTIDIYGLVLEQEGSVPRYSVAVLGQEQDGPAAGTDDMQLTRQLPHLALDESVCGPRAERLSDIRYLHSPETQVRVCSCSAGCVHGPPQRTLVYPMHSGPCSRAALCRVCAQDDVKPVTFWLVLDSARDASLVARAMAYLASGRADNARVGLVFRPARHTSLLNTFLYALLSLPSRRDKIPPFLRELALQDRVWEALALGQSGAVEQAIQLAAVAGLNAGQLEAAIIEAQSESRGIIRHHQTSSDRRIEAQSGLGRWQVRMPFLVQSWLSRAGGFRARRLSRAAHR